MGFSTLCFHPTLALGLIATSVTACGDDSGQVESEGESPSSAEDGDGSFSGGDATDNDGERDINTASGGRAGSEDEAMGTGGGTASDTLVPVFFAQGHLGRTVISCDDGRTWIHDQSDDVGGRRCWTGDNEVECDHNEGAGRGLTSGDGQLFAMFGWGTPSVLRATVDGVDWVTRIEEEADERYGGVAFLDGTLLAAARTSKVSTDNGLTWSDGIDTGLAGWNVRRAGTAGEFFVIVGDAGDVVISADKGLTWQQPAILPAGCGSGIQTRGGVAYGNGALLIVGGDGSACVSTDGGLNFVEGSIGGTADSHLVWSGREFVVYGDGNAYRSADGVIWSATPLSLRANLGPVAVSRHGTFVAVEGGWGDSAWYEGQEFYRSEDGINWAALPAGQFVGGHPMRTLAFGYINPSESCQGGEVQ